MDSEIAFALDLSQRPHVIAFGSEKGGTGKSTTAMHLAVVLTKMGFSVGSIDFDYRQGTLNRYLANRSARGSHGPAACRTTPSPHRAQRLSRGSGRRGVRNRLSARRLQ
ncbi:MAG: division plane positioning ATPase MipZ [Pseudomonadota bacterium]|nr:division plane positioning ATPase MipZ [Pseudomonadota bacterium]